jgi:uncharacterized RmlC-like cupin family protein
VSTQVAGFAVVDASDEEREASHGFIRGWGISRETVGSRNLHMCRGSVPPGVISAAHYHPHSQSAIFVLAGHAVVLVGDQLQEQHRVSPGDFIYIDRGVVHQVINDGAEAYEFVLIRDTDEEVTIDHEPTP